MIVKTRYREIPFEEAIQCHVMDSEDFCRQQWAKWRGQPVAIFTPALTAEERPLRARCDGPFFSKTDRETSVCPHLAELGD